jgi:hypothetical protein
MALALLARAGADQPTRDRGRASSDQDLTAEWRQDLLQPRDAITDPGERLQVGLTQLYRWFEASEPVLTNVARDSGGVQEAAEVAQQPMDEVFQRINETLCHGSAGLEVSPALSLAVGFCDMEEAPPRAGHGVGRHR